MKKRKVGDGGRDIDSGPEPRFWIATFLCETQKKRGERKMSQDVMDIEKEEPRCEEKAIRELADELGINAETFNVFGSLFGETSGKVQDIELKKHQYVHMKLGARMLADLRTIRTLICTGYTPQAAVIASTLLEESLNMWYIGLDDERAQTWLSHSDEKYSVWKVKYLLDEFKRTTGNDLEPTYRQFCQIKHYNPLLGPKFHEKEEYKKIKFHPGPHCEDNIWKEFILMHSSALVVDVLKDIYQSFTKYHASPKKWEEQFKALELEIREFLRKNTE